VHEKREGKSGFDDEMRCYVGKESGVWCSMWRVDYRKGFRFERGVDWLVRENGGH